MLSSESAEEDGQTEGSSDSTAVAVDEENAQLMQFAHADCVELNAKRPVSFLATFKRASEVVLHGIGYLIFLPLWPQRLSRVEARRIRDTFSPSAKQRPWYIGIVPFYFINWLLWHLCKHIRKLDLNIDDGKHAWEIMQGVWSRAFLNKGEFFLFLRRSASARLRRVPDAGQILLHGA